MKTKQIFTDEEWSGNCSLSEESRKNILNLVNELQERERDLVKENNILYYALRKISKDTGFLGYTARDAIRRASASAGRYRLLTQTETPKNGDVIIWGDGSETILDESEGIWNIAHVACMAPIKQYYGWMGSRPIKKGIDYSNYPGYALILAVLRPPKRINPLVRL